MKLFDYVIGNPPYQEESKGEKLSDKPLYNMFMESSYQIADTVELITPARFLFNNGNTPVKWREQMLADKHFKVLCYYANSHEVFSNNGIDIKGGWQLP